MIDIHVGDVLGCVGRGYLLDDYLGQTVAAYRFVNSVINIVKHAHDFIVVDQGEFAAMVANQAIAFTGEGRLFTFYIQGRIIPAKDRPFGDSSLPMHTDSLSDHLLCPMIANLATQANTEVIRPALAGGRQRPLRRRIVRGQGNVG